MRKEVFKETLNILQPFAVTHPGYSYWVVDWTKPNGIEPIYYRSSEKAWAQMMELAEIASDGIADGADGHRVFVTAAPRGNGFKNSTTVVAVWEDDSVHGITGLSLISL